MVIAIGVFDMVVNTKLDTKMNFILGCLVFSAISAHIVQALPTAIRIGAIFTGKLYSGTTLSFLFLEIPDSRILVILLPKSDLQLQLHLYIFKK